MSVIDQRITSDLTLKSVKVKRKGRSVPSLKLGLALLTAGSQVYNPI